MRSLFIVLFGLLLLVAGCCGAHRAADTEEAASLESLGETVWVLVSWAEGEKAPREPGITLTYTDGKFSGKGGCNNYFAPVNEGETTEAISVGPAGSTMMACPPEQMQAETRFHRQLATVKAFTLRDGQLFLAYGKEDADRVMAFAPE